MLKKKISATEAQLNEQAAQLEQLLSENGMLESSLSTVTSRLELQEAAQAKNSEDNDKLRK